MERKPEGKRAALALDAQQVESVLRKIKSTRDHALFWLIYNHTMISVRAAHDYTEADLKRCSVQSSLRSLERSIADNREAAKHQAREWERRQRSL